MATNPNLKTGRMADAIYGSETGNGLEALTADGDEIAPFRTLSQVRDLAPIAYMPAGLAQNPRTRNLRRILTPEQGRALEQIGHAVDYLNDCYVFEGQDSERIDIGGHQSDAIRILVRARQQIFLSAPVREPRMLRIWNAMFHREAERGQNKPEKSDASSSKPISVLPLSSSR